MTSARRMPRKVTGSLVGGVFGLVYVVINAGALPSVPGGVIRVAGVVAFVGLLLRARLAGARTAATSSVAGLGRAYWLVVGGEVLVGAVGIAVLNGPLSAPEAVLPWVSLVVGVHFVALAMLWRQPLYHLLGAGIGVAGVAGLAAALAGANAAVVSAVAGVAPGALLLAVGYWGTQRPGPTPENGREPDDGRGPDTVDTRTKVRRPSSAR